MDECRGNIALDASGNSNRGTLTNFALSGSTSNWVSGSAAKRGCALAFDGVDDYVNIGTAPTLNLNADLTLSVWFKTNSTDSDYIISRLGACANENNVYNIYKSAVDQKIYFITSDNANTVIGTRTVNDGVWHHVVGTISGTTMKIYVDGIQDGNTVTISTSRDSYPSASTEIGAVTVCNPSGGQFNGSIDEVRIYNRALALSEVEGLYNSGSAKINSSTAGKGGNLTTGLVGHWTFDGQYLNTTTATDTSGSANNGTLTGANGKPVPVAGKLGQALSFDGVDDYVSVGTGASLANLPLNSFTMSSWVKPTGEPSVNGRIIDKAGAGGVSGWYVFMNPTTHIVEAYSDFSGGLIAFDAYQITSSGLTMNSWTHVVAVFDISTKKFKIYFNGALQSLSTDTAGVGTALDDSASSFAIGGRAIDGARNFSGSLDDVRIYNRALSAGEVTQLYNLGGVKVKAPSNTGLVGYWSFNEGTGNKAQDFSGGGNTGTLTNSPAWIDGKFSKALNFDGTNDFVNLGDVVDIGTNDMSISMWFKTPITGLNKTLIAKEGGVSPTWGLYSIVAGAGYSEGAINAQFTMDGSNYINVVTNVAFSDNSWHHVIWVVDRDVLAGKVYIDGVLRGLALNTIAGSLVGNMTNAANLRIGARDISGSPLYFSGSIDEVRIYNRALSASEVLNLYNAR